jgi:ABC-2 type transport system ATP-binding protein
MWGVETKALCKSYGAQASLVDCNLKIPQGCVFGLLGPNGAGKSTLLRILLGFLKPTSGTAVLGGYDISTHSLQARAQASYLPGDARLMRSMRGRDLLNLFSGLHPHGSLSRALDVAERLQLDCQRRVMFMSTGMRQKLALAIVIGCQAPVMVLDEPTANLDPNVRSEVVALVNEARQQGRTVILSSHIFSDIDETCEHVAILRAGRVVAEQDMAKLQQSHVVTAQVDLPVESSAQAWCDSLQHLPMVAYSQALPRPNGIAQVELHLSGPPPQWLEWLHSQPLREMNIERGGIRTVYQRFHRSVPAV